MNLNTGTRCCNAGTLRTTVRENSKCKFRPYLPGSTLRISRSVPAGPFDSEIPRVDCNYMIIFIFAVRFICERTLGRDVCEYRYQIKSFRGA